MERVASKFIRIDVDGAESDRSARGIAMSIANPPLVKTAIAGEDVNWGRIVMAIGKAGEPADRDRLGITFGGVQVARGGLAVEGYDQPACRWHPRVRGIQIGVDNGIGDGGADRVDLRLTHG